MRKETILCAALVAAFLVSFGLLLVSLPWLSSPGSQSSTSARLPLEEAQTVPARLSGQAIALTCARMANVDMDGRITLAQAQEMERCAERMLAIVR